MIWHVPYQRNPFFTGRDEVLLKLHAALQADARVALSHPQGISGLGGIGKTQTVLEYAYRYRADYRAVLWVRADSVASLNASMVELARTLELPERNERDQERIVQAVLYWLHTHRDWLLIYDNIDTLSLAEPFLPKAGAGHILFTTRAQALGGLAQRLDIQKMDAETGALLLLRRAEILALASLLSTAQSEEQQVARSISQELDGLPLALDQAGAYIKEAPCPLAEYLTRYRAQRSVILAQRGSLDQGYPASVATTWSLAFQKIQHLNPASVALLHLCAYLAPDAIPESLIIKGAQHLPPDLAHIVDRPLYFDQAIATLRAYSLIQRERDSQTISIHRLVQTVLQEHMPAQSPARRSLAQSIFQPQKPVETQKDWKLRAIRVTDTATPDVKDFLQQDDSELWLPHALLCADWIEQEHVIGREASRLLNSAGLYLDRRARYTEAESLYQRTLLIKQEQRAPLEEVAPILHNLACLYRSQGKYAEAEQKFQQAILILERVFGPMRPVTATSLSALGHLYQDQGRYEEAEALYQRALLIQEQERGPEHPATATSLNNLATLYRTQGRYAEAEQLHLRALTIKKARYGLDHPEVARDLSNLASLLYDTGRYKEAEPLYLFILSLDERVYGPDHPEVATDLNNLGLLYYMQGKHEQSEPLYTRALAIREQQLGPTHPQTAQSLNNLGLLYHSQEKYREAEELFLRALEMKEQQLGPQHPATASTLSTLARVYQAQGKYAEAELLFQRARTINTQKLGAGHLKTASSLHDLARLYTELKQYQRAEPLYRQALTIYEKSVDQEHNTLQAIRENYADLLRKMGYDQT